ncbi:hypothetical protein [Streptomyces sp. NBC_01244]|uniref:hypothetical protein n=1 Tax=Streptomyces sp. NBC_01244 TaxID=2903797 RepID=UPI002E1175EE|nr:hypothetical protein OG247_01665 [Streptomyces sp. NBC_01244]
MSPEPLRASLRRSEMLDTPEAAVEALRENHDRPHGLHRTVTAEEIVDAAELLDEPDALVTALLELMSSYEFTGEHRKSPVVFARLLKLWDTAPGTLSQWEARQVFWRFKWVATSLLQVPEVPLAAIHGWLETMRGRYAAADHGMQPVAAMRYHLAHHTGTCQADAYDLWATRPRTEMSDCEACEIRHLAQHQVERSSPTSAPKPDGSRPRSTRATPPVPWGTVVSDTARRWTRIVIGVLEVPARMPRRRAGCRRGPVKGCPSAPGR